MSYEKWRNDPDYQSQIAKIKEDVDTEFVEKKFEEIPPALTKEKTEAIVQKKQSHINTILMSMIQGGQEPGQQAYIGQKEFMVELMKFDDQIYIEDGFRREQIDRAVTHFGFDKQPSGLGGVNLGGAPSLGQGFEEAEENEESGLRPAGKQIVLT